MGGARHNQKEEPQPNHAELSQQWTFPGELPGQEEEDDDPNEADSDTDWIQLCSLPAAEADATVARLERHGLPCRFAEEDEPREPRDEAATHAILVRAQDLSRAREILSRGVEGDLAESEAELREISKELEAGPPEGWVCPRCDRATLEKLPLSPGWRTVRMGCLGVVLLPLLAVLVAGTVASETMDETLERVPNSWRLMWLIAVGVLAAAVMSGRRHKQCTACDWNSMSVDEEHRRDRGHS